MKRIYFVYAWVFLSVGVILTSIASYQFFNLAKPSTDSSLTSANETLLASSAGENSSDTETSESALDSILNAEVQGAQTIVETEDARATLVSEFLQRYNSPLKPYDYFGQFLVDLADEHQFDFRLLPAIAMQESNLCKVIPPGSYNCLGFGIHSQGTLTFDDFESNFQRAGRELKANYIDEGRTTPEKIMGKYTPLSDGSWADSVNQWMAEMRYNDRQLGIESEEDANVLEFVNEN